MLAPSSIDDSVGAILRRVTGPVPDNAISPLLLALVNPIPEPLFQKPGIYVGYVDVSGASVEFGGNGLIE